MNGLYIEEIQVAAAWNPEWHAITLREAQDGAEVDWGLLKRQLFARHARSWYGTTLDIDDRGGIVVDALTALDYFAQPAPVKFVRFEWNPFGELLLEAGPLLFAAIAEGRFVPDIRRWGGADAPAWKPDWSEAEPAASDQWSAVLERAASVGANWLTDWFSAAVNRLIETDIEVGQALQQRVFSAHPAAGAPAPTVADLDEEALAMVEADWLEAIGWRVDATPFRVVLQLVEPEFDEAPWELRLLLQDKADESRLSVVALQRGGGEAACEIAAGAAGNAVADSEAGSRADEAARDLSAGAGTGHFGAADEAASEAADDVAGGTSEGLSSHAANRTARGTAGDLPMVLSAAAANGASHGEPEDTAAPLAVLSPALREESLALRDVPAEWRADAPRALARYVARCRQAVPELVTPAGERPDTAGLLLRAMLPEAEVWQFLTDYSLRLAESGLSVLLPAWWDAVRRKKPRLQAKVKSTVGSAGASLVGLDQIVAFDWKVAIGDLALSEQEFRELAERKQRFIRFRGQWVHLDPRFLKELGRRMKQVERHGLSLREVLERHLSDGGSEATDGLPDTGGDGSAMDAERDPALEIQLEVQLNRHLKKLVGQLQHSEPMPLLEPPAAFKGQLRSYQLQGASWMMFLRQFGLGGCLADDMGLGKTVQWIAYVLLAKQAGSMTSPALLICPTSVLGNWQKEIARFAPSLRVYLHYGQNRRKAGGFREAIQGADIVLSSYALAHLDAEELSGVAWGTLCLDEAQNIKNAHTKQAAAIRKLNADHRLALTGTPIENRLTELWSIMDFLNPRYLGSLNQFRSRYVNPIEKEQQPHLVQQVQRLIQPFLLRRVKRDPAIQLDLPEKNEYKSYVSLTAEQATLYETVLEEMFERLRRADPMERRGIILGVLTRLKQICDHPTLMLRDASPARDAQAELARSNKLTRLVEMVSELRAEGDRCLIFTQFVEMGHLAVRLLGEAIGEPVLFLHGGVPKSGRDRMVEAFQREDGRGANGIFLLSLKAGGTGLNLTAANHVFHLDRWWNPAVEDQATDRAYRIGQQRDVQVHKFVTLGTLEERIDEMIERKTALSRQIVGAGEQWVTELSTDELRDIFALRREWVEA